jgi:hypothetical protein
VCSGFSVRFYFLFRQFNGKKHLVFSVLSVRNQNIFAPAFSPHRRDFYIALSDKEFLMNPVQTFWQDFVRLLPQLTEGEDPSRLRWMPY